MIDHPFLEQIRSSKDTLPDGEYAMWFPSQSEPAFSESKTRQNLRRIYKKITGIETYILAVLLRRLEVVDQEVMRVRFPNELATFPVVGPKEQTFVLSASQEKGIRFHFHRQHTSAEDRNQILEGFLALIENMKDAVAHADVKLDETIEESPAQWWAYCERVIALKEREGPVQAVGKVLMN